MNKRKESSLGEAVLFLSSFSGLIRPDGMGRRNAKSFEAFPMWRSRSVGSKDWPASAIVYGAAADRRPANPGTDQSHRSRK